MTYYLYSRMTKHYLMDFRRYTTNRYTYGTTNNHKFALPLTKAEALEITRHLTYEIMTSDEIEIIRVIES
jgi:hypothetical protein